MPLAFSPKDLAFGFCSYNKLSASREFFEICEALEVAELIGAVGPFAQLAIRASEARETMDKNLNDKFMA